ncbi:hypothetical protein SAMN04489761_3038 [Tenacibaculum sp. MAR_2009_124]|nr:hypothetical protein SAMN04489761_3038 [Tenacibaculum sp. MAR_2009_124]
MKTKEILKKIEEMKQAISMQSSVGIIPRPNANSLKGALNEIEELIKQ